mgnify:CR=1 FL=1
MSANLEAKKQLVADMQEGFKNAKSIVFVDYKGINVAQDTELRKKFKNENVTYKVYKNRLISRALDGAGITNYDPTLLEGSTAVAFSTIDEVAPARIFAETIKELQKLDIKFGVINGQIFDKSQVESLANIPAKPVLIAMLLGLLKEPMSALVRGLNAIAEKNKN